MSELLVGSPVWVVSPHTGNRERAEIAEPLRLKDGEVWVRLLDVPTPAFTLGEPGASPSSLGSFPDSWIEAR